MTPSLTELRDKLAQEHYDKRAKIFDVHEFDRETIAIESYKLGFDAGAEEERKRAQVLVKTLKVLLKDWEMLGAELSRSYKRVEASLAAYEKETAV